MKSKRILSTLLAILLVVGIMPMTVSAMQVFVYISIEDSTITLNVEAADSIENVKQKIQDKEGISPDTINLFFNGTLLNDGRTLADYNIQNEDTIQVKLKHSHCVCGGTTNIGDHTTHDDIEFTEWDKTDSMPNTTGTYVLMNDVTLSSVWYPADGMVLCLNGNNIKVDDNTDSRVIYIESHKSLVLCDCSEQPGKITGGHDQDWGGGIHIDINATLTMYNGQITGNSAGAGAGVYNSGIFNMYGGKIYGNTADSYGGGVYHDGNTAYRAMKLLGNATITDNFLNDGTDNNLHVGTRSGKIGKVTISDEFSGNVGISMYEYGVFSIGGKDNSQYFTADNPDYMVSTDGDNLKLVELKPVQVGQVELANGEYTTNGEDKTAGTPTGTGYAYYNDGVLTLNEFNYNDEGKNGIIIHVSSDTKINLLGDNSLTTPSSATIGVTALQIDSSAVALTGDGSLNIMVSGNHDYGVYLAGVNAKLNILDTNLSIESYCNSINAGSTASSLYIESSEISLTSSNDYAISVGDVRILNSELELNSGSEYSVFAPTSMTIENSTIVSDGGFAFNSGGALDFVSGSILVQGTYGAFYPTNASLNLPTSDYWWRTASDAEFTKNTAQAFVYGEQNYVEITTNDPDNKVQVGQVELANGEYTTNGEDKTAGEPTDEGYAYYKNGVLTLNNFTYSGGGNDYAAIYSVYPLTIKVEGRNSITREVTDKDTDTDIVLRGIWVSSGELKIIGDNKADFLEVVAYGHENTTSYAVNGNSEGVVIENCTLEAISTTGGAGLYVAGEITVVGAEVLGSSGSISANRDTFGIYAVTLKVKDSDVVAVAEDNSYAGANGLWIAGSTGKLIFESGSIVAETSDVSVDSYAVNIASEDVTLPAEYWMRTSAYGDFAEGAWNGANIGPYIELTTTNPHTHNYTYEANDNIITESCTCGHNETATIVIPTGGLVYEGIEHKAEIEYSIGWIGNKDYELVYLVNGNTPTYFDWAGTYNVSLTVEGAVATASYTIKKSPNAMKNIEDVSKIYDGAAVENPDFQRTTFSDGDVSYAYKPYGADDSEYTNQAPKNAGKYTCRITMAEVTNYEEAIATVDFEISKATPTITTPPTASRITSGSKLEVSVLSDGVASVDGTFAWETPTKEMTNTGDMLEKVIFTPTDTTNYTTAECDVTVNVYRRSSGGGGTTRYTIKFESNGGNKISSKTVTRNSKLTAPDEPTQEGFIFGGWFTDKELTEKYDFDSKVTKSFTLYAKWEIDEEQTQPIEPTGWENPFIDVNTDDWFYDVVKEAYINGLIKGTSENTFSPNGDITRGMFVTILYRAEGEPAARQSIPFADVKATDYYANAVIWAQQNEIVNGISENEFAPNANITREQMAVILYRYAQFKEYDVSVGENTNILSYTDFDKISEYAIPAMQYAAGSGLIKGRTESTLNPQDNATRAETAAILQRFIEMTK